MPTQSLTKLGFVFLLASAGAFGCLSGTAGQDGEGVPTADAGDDTELRRGSDCADHRDNDGDGFCDVASGYCLDGTKPGDSDCTSKNAVERSSSACLPSPEVCDSKDNDCDGSIDEGGVCCVPVCVTVRDATVEAGKTVQLQADVVGVGTIDKSVTWSVDPASLGTIDPVTGVYSAPAAPGTYRVWATSNADSTKRGVGTVTVTAPPPTRLAAFPGCQGAGCYTRGGFNTSAGTPTIYRVTSLATGTGPGTLGACIAAYGPRVCTFAVAGTIHGPGYTITNPHITIRGDTAPGMGIMLDNNGVSGGIPLRVSTSDVVIRGLRTRDGNPSSATDNYTDAFSIYPANTPTNNIVLDHMSISWGNDESFDIYSSTAGPANQPRDITLSYTIIGEGLWHNDGEAMGALIAGDSADHALADAMTDIDIHHSFFANNYKRNPEFRIARGRFVNNIVYNWGDGAATFDDGMEADVINNIGRFGPNTDDYPYLELFRVGYFTNTAASGIQSVYLAGNKYYGGAVQGFGTGLVRNAGTVSQRSGPLAPAASGPGIVPEATDAIVTSVIGPGGAGHSRRLDCGGAWVTTGVMDSVDTRFGNSFLNPPTSYAFPGCTGAACWPRTPADVGGFPVITPISERTLCSPTSRDNTSCVCADTDTDGMPDYWERAWCGVASGTGSCSALGTTVASPWTNLEAFQSGSVVAP